MLQRSKVL